MVAATPVLRLALATAVPSVTPGAALVDQIPAGQPTLAQRKPERKSPEADDFFCIFLMFEILPLSQMRITLFQVQAPGWTQPRFGG